MGSRKLFGTNGIRGIVTKELTPEMAVKVVSAIGTFFKTKSLLVGHDARTSGPMFAEAVISGLNAAGCDVLLAGMASTPALQFAVKNHGFDGGVIVTASHNPPEYNGIKVIWSNGIEISHEQETQIEDIYFDEKAHLAEWDKLGATHELPGVNEEYVEAIEKHVHTARIASKHFHIVVDAANSVGGLAAPILLRKLGCRVTSINTNIDGTFPGRPPEPRPENLWDVALTVKALGADVGVAFDGDADRAIFIAETGEKLTELVAEQPQYFIEKGKVECPEEKKEKLLDTFKQRVQALRVSMIDGAKIWFDDKSAILVRPSGTEPVFRLYTEAKNQKRALALVEEYSSTLKKILKHL